jgi:hypothetical protein
MNGQNSRAEPVNASKLFVSRQLNRSSTRSLIGSSTADCSTSGLSIEEKVVYSSGRTIRGLVASYPADSAGGIRFRSMEALALLHRPLSLSRLHAVQRVDGDGGRNRRAVF